MRPARTTKPDKNGKAAPPTKRVAIYTRKSVTRGLDQEFNSLDNQREAIEAYVASQRAEGWVVLPDRYDDGGFTGANTERPAFQRLMDEVRSGEIDVVAVYKIDRLSRSLRDFGVTMAEFEQHGVEFVSVTQQFSTATSMGKLTLNILMSFAEFEREVNSERVRDKIRATRLKGHWTGGRPLLGYDAADGKLVVNHAEADTVRWIFGCYRERGSITETLAELDRRGVRTKLVRFKNGKASGGQAFSRSTLAALLRNRLYVGELRCGDEWVDGVHEGIVEKELFDAVQELLSDNRRYSGASTRNKHGALLRHLAFCGRCGERLIHHFTTRGTTRHRYYVCQTSLKRGTAACPGSRAPAVDLEEVVISKIRGIGRDPDLISATIAEAERQAAARKPELTAESRRLGREVTELERKRRRLLDAVENGDIDGGPLFERIAELDQDIAQAKTRRDEVAIELADIASHDIDEDRLRRALAAFDPLWDRLVTSERERLLRALVDRVVYDPDESTVTVDLRSGGITQITEEGAA